MRRRESQAAREEKDESSNDSSEDDDQVKEKSGTGKPDRFNMKYGDNSFSRKGYGRAGYRGGPEEKEKKKKKKRIELTLAPDQQELLKKLITIPVIN